MKSPQQLAEKLARQWAHADTREQRLLAPESWPIELTIGKPNSMAIKQNIEGVRAHFQQWRKVAVGEVIWEGVAYRDTQEAIPVPTRWRLHKPSDWVTATHSQSIAIEFQTLAHIISKVDTQFHSLLIRQRHLIANKSEEEIIQACQLAMQLEQGCAEAIPLRALSLAGIDSKFFERHRRLIIKLLDTRFDGLISDIGLEEFLDALKEDNHWLLIADLDGKCLPFKQLRLRDSELAITPLPANNILIIENERCLHQLPTTENTIAILGAGLNLNWMKAAWLADKSIAYWGDIDTWGLTMLAQARQHQPTLTALLMSQKVFQEYSKDKAVTEPKPAGDTPPEMLSTDEKTLYHQLLSEEKGRLEQEFLTTQLVQETVLSWMGG